MVVHGKVVAVLVAVLPMTPATSKMSSQVSFVSTAQGMFNAMIWATFSTVLQSFIKLAL